MGAFMDNGDNGGPMSEINITPFVDVMLVLLVIFMVTAPLLESGIPLELPRAKAKSIPQNTQPVTLNITKSSQIYLNRKEVFLSQLQPTLVKYFRNKTQKQIYIRADGSLPYSFVAQTMAAVKLAGISKIGLVTLPPEDPANR